MACITGSFDIPAFDGECNYTNVLNAFTEHTFNPVNIGFTCTNTPAQELALLLGLGPNDDATDAVRDQICISAWDNAPTVAFEKIRNALGEEYYEFAQQYYNGNTYWNEQTETKYPDGERRYILREDAAMVDRFYDNDAENARVLMPVKDDAGTPLPNFDSCESNAIYCCWPRDRQAGDNNGNCNREYDLNCHDKNPADNTDLCYVDYSRGAKTLGWGSGGKGWMNFPFDDNNNEPYRAEGPIHCHGFAWSEDPYHPSARYAGNNMFYISMYDHMTQRGYVENIPGAPMCACAEQMPIVSRSDCTQIDVEESYSVSYDGTSFAGKLVDAVVDFNSCQGWNNQNNDLWAYMQRLYYDDKEVGSDKLAGLSQSLVEDDNCKHAHNKFAFDEHALVYGYEHDTKVWTQVAGRDSFEVPSYGVQGFKLISEEDGDGRGMILRRTCATCDSVNHLNIYYKRLTPVPADMDLLFELKNRRSTVVGNVYGTDFELYGTYEDALNSVNEWECANYRHDQGFPGDCAPYGRTLQNQESRFESWYGWKSHVGWYAETPSAEYVLDVVSQGQDIGYVRYAGQTLTDNDGTYYMSATGSDIWGTSDNFHYMSESVSATEDFSIEVTVDSLSYEDYWTKACIMVRDTLDADAVHYDLCLTGQGGVIIQLRRETGGSTGSSKEYDDLDLTRDGPEDGPLNTVKLKLVKRGNTYRGMWMFANESIENGDEWKLWRYVDTMDNLGLTDGNLQIGLALTSHDNYISEVVFKDYTITTGLTFDNLPDPVVPPYPADTTALTLGSDSFDVGTATTAGSAAVKPDGTTYYIAGAGSNIFNSQDSFHYAIPSKHSGDFVVTAKFARYSNYASDWAKAGIMIRKGIATGQESHASAIMQAQKGVALILRDGDDGSGSMKYRKSENPLDSSYLRLMKIGNVITCYESYTDVLAWKYTGQHTMNSWVNDDTSVEYYVGMAVSSHSSTELAYATFEEYEVLPL